MLPGPDLARVLVLRAEENPNFGVDRMRWAWSERDPRSEHNAASGRGNTLAEAIHRALMRAESAGCRFVAFPWGTSTGDVGVEFYAASTPFALAEHVLIETGKRGANASVVHAQRATWEACRDVVEPVRTEDGQTFRVHSGRPEPIEDEEPFQTRGAAE